MLDHSDAVDVVLKNSASSVNGTVNYDPQDVLRDYRLCRLSREASLLGRRDVLTGYAKFGIFGDGKELPQVVLAKHLQPGDFRSGYYRDQTLMLALGLCTVEDLFAQLYADPQHDPFTRGRQMNAHFATPLIDKHGAWTDHRTTVNITADSSNTAGQMARAVGLALASKTYRRVGALQQTPFSRNGDEVTYVTIGDASTSEGVFFEAINAAAVQQIPMFINVWDDGYGISVPVELQTAKGSISAALAGFADDGNGNGLLIEAVNGNDYDALNHAYRTMVPEVRATHKPALLHVYGLTQPQGHSTSGSHQRYKSKDRLEWEVENDCLTTFRKFILDRGFATEQEVKELERSAKKEVRDARDRAYRRFQERTNAFGELARGLFAELMGVEALREVVLEVQQEMDQIRQPVISEYVGLARRVRFFGEKTEHPALERLDQLIEGAFASAHVDYHDGLYSNTPRAAVRAAVVRPQYAPTAEQRNGYEIINEYFKRTFARRPEVIAFGEDVGHIGDVNQGFAGVQEAHGKDRVFDTGIRELTIMGQAIGTAMRGLRPIAEIQYLDYLLYGLQPLSDDLATLRWRSGNQQMAPAIIRTRGHRLEGVWHAGSPLQMMLGSLRGMYVCVPRNFTQAAGMYETLLRSDDPAIVVEPLNSYRQKEALPTNLGDYTVPLGVPEVLRPGTDVTLVTYGSLVRIADRACTLLERRGISVELIDVQTLLPFDLEGRIAESLKRTNRVLFVDEDLPGGATAYMLQQVLEVQRGYRHLDAPAQTLSARAHRTPYGSDGDYFTKPQLEDIVEAVARLARF